MVQHRGVDINKLKPTHVKPVNFSSGQLVKDSNPLNPLYLVSPASDSTRLTLSIGLWSTEIQLMFYGHITAQTLFKFSGRVVREGLHVTSTP